MNLSLAIQETKVRNIRSEIRIDLAIDTMCSFRKNVSNLIQLYVARMFTATLNSDRYPL